MFSIKPPILKNEFIHRNMLGLTLSDYQGGLSTLCGGCGHDSITHAIIQACFESDILPHKVAKFSGIGCSSKTPAYFLQTAHGFNSVHGRMPSVVTGASLADSEMIYLAVSGDGDTGSIGLGQFMHLIRRQVNMLYIVENNGVYGLTKGQFSATSDLGAVNKKQDVNPFEPIDLVSLAIQLGAGFVARSFSGDKSQLVPLIKAGLNFKGFALIDVLSPCVSFNNHEASTKSYQHIRQYEEEPLHLIDYVPNRDAIHVEIEVGQTADVLMHDGSLLKLHKNREDYNPQDRSYVISYLEEKMNEGRISTGLLYCKSGEELKHFSDHNKLGKKPLRDLPWDSLHPGLGGLEKINQQLR